MSSVMNDSSEFSVCVYDHMEGYTRQGHYVQRKAMENSMEMNGLITTTQTTGHIQIEVKIT